MGSGVSRASFSRASGSGRPLDTHSRALASSSITGPWPRLRTSRMAPTAP